MSKLNYGKRHKTEPKLGRASNYYRPEPGEPRIVPLGGVRFSVCCDCGLVHTTAYSLENGKIIERVWRNERSTALFRRRKAKEGDFVPVPDSNVYILPLRIQQKRAIKRVTVTIEPGDPKDVAIDSTATLHNSRASGTARGKGDDRKRARGTHR